MADIYIGWPAGADKTGLYLCATSSYNPQHLVESFLAKYKSLPKYVFLADKLLRVGPLPDGKR